MERATKKVKISDGRIVEMYTYVTGRESREIQQIFLEGTKIHFDGIGGTAPSDIDASLAMKAGIDGLTMFESVIASVVSA